MLEVWLETGRRFAGYFIGSLFDGFAKFEIYKRLIDFLLKGILPQVREFISEIEPCRNKREQLHSPILLKHVGSVQVRGRLEDLNGNKLLGVLSSVKVKKMGSKGTKIPGVV